MTVSKEEMEERLRACDPFDGGMSKADAAIERLRGEANAAAEAGLETPERLVVDVESPSKYPSCSFCGAGSREAKKLIAGPTVFICEKCTATAFDIVSGALPVKCAWCLASLSNDAKDGDIAAQRHVLVCEKAPHATAIRAAEARVRALEAEIRAWAEAVCAHSTGPDQIQRITGRVVERRAALDAKPSPAPGQESAAGAGAEAAAPPARGDAYWQQVIALVIAEAYRQSGSEQLARELTAIAIYPGLPAHPPAQAAAAPSPGAAREVAEAGPQAENAPQCADCGTVDRARSACPECRKVVCRDCAERGPKAHVTCCDETAERNAPQPELLRSLVETLTTADARLAPIYSHHSGDEIARAPEGSQLGLWRDGLLALRGALALLRGERRASDKRANRHPTPPAVAGPKEGA